MSTPKSYYYKKKQVIEYSKIIYLSLSVMLFKNILLMYICAVPHHAALLTVKSLYRKLTKRDLRDRIIIYKNKFDRKDKQL